MKHNARTNALVGAGVAACAVAGTLLNEPQSRWYRSLRKPDWQPAPAVFPIAWTALYAAVGLSSASVINRLNKAGWDQDAAAFARALGVNLALNTGWSALSQIEVEGDGLALVLAGHRLPGTTGVDFLRDRAADADTAHVATVLVAELDDRRPVGTARGRRRADR